MVGQPGMMDGGGGMMMDGGGGMFNDMGGASGGPMDDMGFNNDSSKSDYLCFWFGHACFWLHDGGRDWSGRILLRLYI